MNTEKTVPFEGQDGVQLAIPPNTDGVITPNLRNLEARVELERLVQTGHLRPHRLAEQIYGKFGGEEDALLESVRAQGILTPLLVTPDGTVVAGSERLRVANELGLEEVPVRVLDLREAAEIEEKLIESNVARQKTEEQKIREYRELKRTEAGKAAGRKGARHDLMENLPAGQNGAARDLAAAKIGWHTYQVLTKRADRMAELLQGKLRFAADLPHIWWGTSVEDQRYGVPRIDQLRQAPGRVRFLSIEPLLEDIGPINLDGIAWVICGGESGPGARPIRLSWVTSIRDQCQRAGVPFFFKQWGGVHKSMTGCLLEGRTHDGYPPRINGPVITDAEGQHFIDEMAMKYRLELPTTKRFVTHEHADVR